jgi:dUTP pyrophosphatase
VGLDLTLKTVERVGPRLFMADSGVRVAPPIGYYIEIVPRSSLMWRGVIMPNSFGVIDPGYRGTLRIPLLFVGDPGEAIEETLKSIQDDLTGQRLVQLVLRKQYPCEVVEVPNLSDEETDRGERGFGSSGSS